MKAQYENAREMYVAMSVVMRVCHNRGVIGLALIGLALLCVGTLWARSLEALGC